MVVPVTSSPELFLQGVEIPSSRLVALGTQQSYTNITKTTQMRECK
jgi:hypothetical protein